MKLARQISSCTIMIALFIAASSAMAAKTSTAIFAGGCFWSMQHDFDKVPGVVQTTVGYTGGHVPNPTYDQVSMGDTGHYESIKIVYDPEKISYQKLLDFYWHDIDPTDTTGQFCDNGNEYHSVIFYMDDEQHKMATESMDQLAKSQRFNQIATLIMPAKTFYPAEEYHQKYAEKNPAAYSAYRIGCGRDERSREIWGAP